MKKILFAVVAGAVFAAAPAMAADDGGFYVGAGVGSFGVDVGGFGGDDVGFKAFGGWMFNPYVGGELEYIDGGSAEDAGQSIDITGWNLSLKAAYPIDQFNVFAKVGYFMWDADVRTTLYGNGSEDGNDFSWGVGAGYDFTENFGVALEYQGFEVQDTDTVDLISASVHWKF